MQITRGNTVRVQAAHKSTKAPVTAFRVSNISVLLRSGCSATVQLQLFVRLYSATLRADMCIYVRAVALLSENKQFCIHILLPGRRVLLCSNCSPWVATGSQHPRFSDGTPLLLLLHCLPAHPPPHPDGRRPCLVASC
jgi:hypothetical protein